MKSLYGSSLLGLVLVGCQVGDGLEDYYGDGTPPSVSGIDVTSVPGNTGGGTAVITGSGFGDDPAAVSVVFGQVNAQVLEATGDSLTVAIPQGPVQGGAVDVRVGTTGGQASLDGGFTYDIGEGYENQSAYILINNDWYSCYGGVGEPGCETIAYVGLTGITGRGEFLTETTFPRQHGMFTGYWGGADVTLGEWSVSKPAYNYVGLDVEDNVEDVRDKRITGFTLRNPVYDQLNENQRNFCADISNLASWTYGGGDPVYDDATGDLVGVSDAVSVSYADPGLYEEAATERVDGEQVCADADDRMFDVSEMRFCETWYDQDANTKAYQRAGTWIYDAEWPVGEFNFFAGDEAIDDTLDEPTNVTIQVDVPEADVDENIVLPPWPFFTATAGIEDVNSGGQLWGVGTFASCPDGNGDGATSLDEAGIRFEWLPADLGDVVGGNIKAVNNTVRVSLNVFYLGWYGGEGITLRAHTTVPDDNLVDPETGMAMVEVPADVLLQFPSVDATFGLVQGPFGNTFTWGDPTRGDYGYLIVTLERVTEYTIEAPSLEGDLVVAYAAGDFGFFEWNNPLDSTADCGDCQDGDGDGWTDRDDPDCADPDNDVEDNATFGGTTCNDGLDNDGDGKIDAEDEDCEDGYDGETNCSDGVDNDGDGLVDGQDGECAEGGGVEVGDDDPDWQCGNGLDDDGDGWIDFDDPDCGNAADDELGFGLTECNDGIDNDGHGDIDGEDFICAFRGADYETEEPVMAADCINDLDDDGDGFVDRNDPDCELQPYSSERFDSAQSSWGWSSQCYNATDDDGDGEIDALDLGCEDGTGTPDGFLNDESVADHPDGGGGDTGGGDTGS